MNLQQRRNSLFADWVLPPVFSVIMTTVEKSLVVVHGLCYDSDKTCMQKCTGAQR